MIGLTSTADAIAGIGNAPQRGAGTRLHEAERRAPHSPVGSGGRSGEDVHTVWLETGCRLIAPHTPYPCVILELRTECSNQASMSLLGQIYATPIQATVDTVPKNVARWLRTSVSCSYHLLCRLHQILHLRHSRHLLYFSFSSF